MTLTYIKYRILYVKRFLYPEGQLGIDAFLCGIQCVLCMENIPVTRPDLDLPIYSCVYLMLAQVLVGEQDAYPQGFVEIDPDKHVLSV